MSLRAYNYDLPEAKRLTRVLAELDPHLRCGWDGMLQKYVVTAPSQREGRAVVQILEHTDGRPIAPDTAPMLLLAEMARRKDRRLDIRKLQEQQAAAIEKRWEAQMEELGEWGGYVAKAAAQEFEGTLRGGVEDVFDGLYNAIHGTARPQQGRLYSLPR